MFRSMAIHNLSIVGRDYRCGEVVHLEDERASFSAAASFLPTCNGLQLGTPRGGISRVTDNILGYPEIARRTGRSPPASASSATWTISTLSKVRSLQSGWFRPKTGATASGNQAFGKTPSMRIAAATTCHESPITYYRQQSMNARNREG